MYFQDKETANRQPFYEANGELTEDFISVAETVEEDDAMQAAISNLALLAMTKDSSLDQLLDKDDAEIILEYIYEANQSRSRQTVTPDEATRFAQLLRLGGTLLPNSEQSACAISMAEAMEQEIATRAFRKDLRQGAISPNDFL